MLQRPVGELIEFVTFSLWDSLDAIKAFAGDDYETAVFYPEDDRYLVERDLHVHPLGGRAHGWLAWRAVSDATNGAGRPLVSVVVPVYNEAATVGQVVEELLELAAAARDPAGRRRLHRRLAGRAGAARGSARARSRCSRSRATAARARPSGAGSTSPAATSC